eukprot:504467-Prymnesium_polylepis.1
MGRRVALEYVSVAVMSRRRSSGALLARRSRCISARAARSSDVTCSNRALTRLGFVYEGRCE